MIHDEAEKNVFRSQNLANSKTNDRRSSSFSWPPDKSQSWNTVADENSYEWDYE